HRNPAPRVPRPCHCPERDPPASLAARLPHLLPPLPNPPLTGEGRTRAETGGSPRPGRCRCDAHGRRPASPVHTAGCVGSPPPSLLTGDAEGPVSRLRPAAVGPPPLPLKSARNRVDPTSRPSHQRPSAQDERPQPLLRAPGWANWKGQGGCGQRRPRREPDGSALRLGHHDEAQRGPRFGRLAPAFPLTTAWGRRPQLPALACTPLPYSAVPDHLD